MRGKVSGDYSEIDYIGITPAYAGKSFSEIENTYEYQDHPRLCGEKYY